MDVKARKQKRETLRRHKFIRVDSLRKRLEKKWRRPKAWHHNKSRRRDLVKIRNVRIGYRTPKELRGIHPSGYEEILVSNLNDLRVINPETQAVKIRRIGGKKKKAIIVEAKKLSIKILNPGAEK